MNLEDADIGRIAARSEAEDLSGSSRTCVWLAFAGILRRRAESMLAFFMSVAVHA